MTLGDNAELFGGIAIDGPGRLVTGQSSGPRPTLTYLEHGVQRAGLVRHHGARAEHLARAPADLRSWTCEYDFCPAQYASATYRVTMRCTASFGMRLGHPPSVRKL